MENTLKRSVVEQLDKEWGVLITEALDMGLTVEEIQTFFVEKRRKDDLKER